MKNVIVSKEKMCGTFNNATEIIIKNIECEGPQDRSFKGSIYYTH